MPSGKNALQRRMFLSSLVSRPCYLMRTIVQQGKQWISVHFFVSANKEAQQNGTSGHVKVVCIYSAASALFPGEGLLPRKQRGARFPPCCELPLSLSLWLPGLFEFGLGKIGKVDRIFKILRMDFMKSINTLHQLDHFKSIQNFGFANGLEKTDLTGYTCISFAPKTPWLHRGFDHHR